MPCTSNRRWGWRGEHDLGMQPIGHSLMRCAGKTGREGRSQDFANRLGRMRVEGRRSGSGGVPSWVHEDPCQAFGLLVFSDELDA
jgi:hypothetical protein